VDDSATNERLLAADEPEKNSDVRRLTKRDRRLTTVTLATLIEGLAELDGSGDLLF
jgi:hypothetical protein